MGKQPFINGYLLLGGVDLSDHIESMSLDESVADVNVTAMGDGGIRRVAGLTDAKINVTFWQDYAPAKVNATLRAIYSGGTAVPFKIAANGSSFGTANPTWSGNALLVNFQSVGGKVGDGLQAPIQLVVDGTVTAGTS